MSLCAPARSSLSPAAARRAAHSTPASATGARCVSRRTTVSVTGRRLYVVVRQAPRFVTGGLREAGENELLGRQRFALLLSRHRGLHQRGLGLGRRSVGDTPGHRRQPIGAGQRSASAQHLHQRLHVDVGQTATAAVGCGRSCSGSGCAPIACPPLRHCSAASRGPGCHRRCHRGRFLRRNRLAASPCSRLLASFDSNPEKPPLPSPSDPPFRPAFRDRSAVASPAAIGGCDTAPVFIACLPRSRSRPPVRLPCALAPAPGLQPRLPDWPQRRLGIRRIGQTPHLTLQSHSAASSRAVSVSASLLRSTAPSISTPRSNSSVTIRAAPS